jgi:hypothetical protein
MKINTWSKAYSVGAAVILMLLSFFIGSIFIARAQSAPSQGLSITPFLLERQMNKGDTLNEIIDITNTSNVTMPVDVQVSDFYPQGDNGQPVYVDPGLGDPRYSLSKWITIISNPKPVLAPGQETSINFNITPPADADDGGHYGALLFSSEQQSPNGTGSAVIQKVAAIILVQLGKASPAGSISEFQTEHGFYEYPPVTFVTRFDNTGNVHVAPRGGISIYNMFGKKVGIALVNENANNVLPSSERVFDSDWNTRYAFGRYTALVQLVYDQSGTVVSATTSFWIIPWRTTLVFGLILFILILIVVYGIKSYNRWLIKKIYGAKK